MADLHDERFVEMIEELDDGHIEVKLDFIPVCDQLPGDDIYNSRVLAFAPCYPEGHSMRYRTAPSQFIKTMTDITHWAEIPEIKEACDEY